MDKMRALCWLSMAAILVFAVNVDGTSHHKRSGRWAKEGDIRLRGGYNGTAGRVEIFHYFRWGTVCDNRWSIDNAQVVCRQLGLRGGQNTGGAMFGRGKGRVLMDEVRCSGREKRLADCPFQGWGSTLCSHYKDAGVICAPERDGEVRLDNGLLEIFSNNEFRRVCDAGSFSLAEADVVCREIGKGQGNFTTVIFRDNATFANAVFRCNGDESVLRECSSTTGPSACSTGIHITCAQPRKDDLRLISMDAQIDSFQIYDTKWSRVCLLRGMEANIVCRSFGYSDGNVFNGYRSSESGQTTELLECAKNALTMASCDFKNHLGCQGFDVQCRSLRPGEIRLVDGMNTTSGRVEIQLNGRFQSICGRGWTDRDAQVVCRQLGFRGGVAPGAGFFGGKRYGPIYSTHNGCYGSEARLLDCGQKEEVGDQCLHEEDAAVICNLGPCSPGLNTCQNGGLCYFTNTLHGVGDQEFFSGYRCECLGSYRGRNCEIEKIEVL